ncbi:MAG: monooxygenase [Alcaligenaceae bacterium]|nr:monooxygenase [Alcaligenaceae bacterium]
MPNAEYDLVITGAGPAGSTLALLLARYAPDPARIALIGNTFLSESESPDLSDPRSIAVNYGSQVVLQSVHGWPSRHSPIETVHVSQRQRLGRTLIRNTDFNVPRLGSVVAYPDLLQQLHRALHNSGVTLIQGTTPATQATTTGVTVTLAETGAVLHAHMAVQSDGVRPKGLERQYDQAAILATVTASAPLKGWAFERFTREGPLAVLPHPSGANHYGLVWCCQPARANELAGFDDAAFDAALLGTFGQRLGHLKVNSPRRVYPLTLNAGPVRLDPRRVAIGNAAQTLHPVAGQGLNLGLRDAAQLAHTLRFWVASPCQSPEPALDTFTRQRRADRWTTGTITDVLPRIFATGNPLVEHACGLGLLAMDLSPALRTPLATHLLQGLRT